MGNLETLEKLFADGGIDLRRGALFDYALGPMPESLDFDRVEGMLLGLAVGDALGNTTEGWLPGPRRARYGEIRDYLPNEHAGNKAICLPSDDTQLAFWTLEQMLEDGGLNPENLTRRFCSGRIYGIGSAVKQFVSNFEEGLPWYECGIQSAGNGSLMRIAPVLLPHLRKGGRELWSDVALAAMVTHNDSAAISACLSFVHLLWKALASPEPPAAEWWLEEYTRVAQDLEDGEYCSRSPFYGHFRGPLWRFVEEAVGEAWRRGLPTVDACNRWYSGAYLLETVPSVIYILMRHGHDLEEAIVRAVNDAKDNDTVAAIVGAAVGAVYGRRAIPDRWLRGLLGQTRDADEGRVFQLVDEAREAWWSSGAP